VPTSHIFDNIAEFDLSKTMRKLAERTVKRDEPTPKKVSEIKNTPKLLLAGIAKPKPFFAYLQQESDIVLTYPDHHHFSENDIQNIKKQAENKPIITTEKDYVRLKNYIPSTQLFYLPIKTSFISESRFFDQTILNYVGKITTNR
jgi:tetraacyldisaccharide 4'-kinase